MLHRVSHVASVRMLRVYARNEFYQFILLRTFLNHEFLDVARHLFGWFGSTLVEVPSLIVKLGIMILDAKEGLDLVRLFNGWDHNDVLQVALQGVAAVNHHV